MIFVTVGTHEQPFNRLMKELEIIKDNYKLKDEIIIQGGYSTYHPHNCTFYKFLDYDQMNNYMEKARIVITHGGPATMIMSLQHKKIPIVVPRQVKFDEHINNHQVEFASKISSTMQNILLVLNIKDLKKNIFDYNNLTKSKQVSKEYNNNLFNKKLEQLVKKMGLS